ncbi:hypothetical protein HK100_008443 [Physocladia obscura]|uniref:Uncharacterized protein n=1 Tax=Physocladia obscura TaxID=109957 RepID=A0AAD5XJP9_9FUNG|nr:hypothetical protein HK100_008443 [Physocladia obscura]
MGVDRRTLMYLGVGVGAAAFAALCVALILAFIWRAKLKARSSNNNSRGNNRTNVANYSNNTNNKIPKAKSHILLQNIGIAQDYAQLRSANSSPHSDPATTGPADIIQNSTASTSQALISTQKEPDSRFISWPFKRADSIFSSFSVSSDTGSAIDRTGSPANELVRTMSVEKTYVNEVTPSSPLAPKSRSKLTHDSEVFRMKSMRATYE